MFTLLAEAVFGHVAIFRHGFSHALDIVLTAAPRNKMRNSTRVIDSVFLLNGIPQGPPGSFKPGRRLRNGAPERQRDHC